MVVFGQNTDISFVLNTMPFGGKSGAFLAIFGQKIVNFRKVHVKIASGDFSQYIKLKVNC
jgi:hypothetical protein